MWGEAPSQASDWPTITKRQRKNWYERRDGQRGDASAEAARTAAGGAAENGPGAPLATTHGPAAEALEATAAAAVRVQPPRPSNWGLITRKQREIGGSSATGGHVEAQVMAGPGLLVTTRRAATVHYGSRFSRQREKGKQSARSG